MAKITTFTPDTARQIAAFVRDELRKSSPTLTRFDRVTPRTREVRWAITATNYSFPTYPTTGDVVMVQFGDYEPDTSTQNIEPTKTIAWGQSTERKKKITQRLSSRSASFHRKAPTSRHGVMARSGTSKA